MRKKVGIIGQFPPPIHGLSKALDTLYNSYLNEQYNFEKIDITNNSKFIMNLFKIIFTNLDFYYLTISQSKFGNIRDLILIKLIKLKNKKLIIHLHGGGFRNLLIDELSKTQRDINYKLLSKVDAAIVLGDSLRYIFKDIIPDEKVYVVKNCVDDEFVISNDEFTKKINEFEKKENINILYLSNFNEDKGYKHVLNLAKKAKENGNKRFKFTFAGKFFSNEDKDAFFTFIKDNSLENYIQYLGVVQGEKKISLLKECDYFILLTKYKNEGQPISIIEAAVNGLRIITTNHAGICDILNDKQMLVYDKNIIDIDKVYEVVNVEFSNRKKIIETLRNNRKSMLINFSEEKYLHDLNELFKKF